MRRWLILTLLTACGGPETDSKPKKRTDVDTTPTTATTSSTTPTETTTDCSLDFDGDGFTVCDDCDDFDELVFPGAEDVCDGIDNDCDAIIDQAADGYGSCVAEFHISEKIDLLFVIDNSCSMFEEQTALASGVSAILDPYYADGVDFHAGVVTTDMGDAGQLQQSAGRLWADSTQLQAEAEAFLDATIILGTSGSGIEKGRDSAHAALVAQSAPGAFNDGFLRADADLGVIFLSDEDDSSVDISVGNFIAWMTGLKLSGEQVAAHSIVSPTPVCATASVPGADYEAITTAVGGRFESVCSLAYQGALIDIATLYGPHPADEFRLGVDTSAAAIRVEIVDRDGIVTVLEDPDVSWDAVEQAVVLLSDLAPLLSDVTIWYGRATPP